MSGRPAEPPGLLARLRARVGMIGATASGRTGTHAPHPVAIPAEPDAAKRRVGYMRDMELLIADGKARLAADSMRDYLESEPLAPDAMHVRYRRLLEQLGDVAALGEHTHTWVSRLLRGKRERDALATVHSTLQRDPTFRVRDADQRTRLARAAINGGMPDVALALAADFHITHPRHTAVPELALVGARLLVDRIADTHAALALLRFAAERFPDDPSQPEIALKIEQIEALDARVGR